MILLLVARVHMTDKFYPIRKLVYIDQCARQPII